MKGFHAENAKIFAEHAEHKEVVEADITSITDRII
jgi:hypothetical protein